jgi:2-keto-4-pentenoate hydratase
MNRTEKTARKLFDNWNLKTPYEALSGEFAVGSVADAYDVQLFLQDLHIPNRGGIAGRKIALSSKAMQQMVGLDDPVAGGIFSGDIALSPATIKTSDFIRLGLEFELAVELKSDVLPQTQIHTSQSAYEGLSPLIRQHRM